MPADRPDHLAHTDLFDARRGPRDGEVDEVEARNDQDEQGQPGEDVEEDRIRHRFQGPVNPGVEMDGCQRLEADLLSPLVFKISRDYFSKLEASDADAAKH